MAIPSETRTVLEKFLLSNELFHLESRFARFNVFEALGVVRKEVHHSSFLAYLLNPSEGHGLRDSFARQFLQEAMSLRDDPPLSVVDLDSIDLSQMTVRREYHDIDIFLSDSSNKIVVVVENKVGSKQHDNQLERYYRTATAKYPAFSFLGIFLTEDGDDSGHVQYVSLSYTKVRDLVKELLARESILLTPAFRSVLEQYSDLLGRRFMADTELKKLCSSIYKKHKQAIDILRNNLPDSLGVALETIKELVEEDSSLTLLEGDNKAIRFIPKSFDIPRFQSESAWLSSKNQMVYLICRKKNDGLVFEAKMDGGSPEERTWVHKFAATHKPFKVDKAVYAKYQVLYLQELLDESFSVKKDEEVVSILRAEWKKLIETIIPAMSHACLEIAESGG